MRILIDTNVLFSAPLGDDNLVMVIRDVPQHNQQ